MILSAVMDEIGDAIEAAIPATDLNVHRFPVDSISPPAAIVQFPTINFDQSFGRGTDRMEGGIAVIVSRVWDEASREAIAPYLDGSGAKSIHAALHAYTTGRLWTTCSYARVVQATIPRGGAFAIGDVTYVGYQFDLDIAGPGS